MLFLGRRDRPPPPPSNPIQTHQTKQTTTQEGKNPDAPDTGDEKGDEYQSLALQRLSLDFPFLPLPKLREWLAEKGGGAYFKVCMWGCLCVMVGGFLSVCTHIDR